MKVETIKINDLKPYEKNQKKHPKEQIDKLARSITSFGFNTPIIIDKDNVIIAGHGRLEAAKSCGMTEVPCIRKEDLSPEKVKAYRIADNKLAESDWDVDLLKEEFANLKLADFDLTLTGFDLTDVNSYFKGLNEDLEEVEPEEAENIETDIKTGDLILLGNHKLFCGDSTNESDMKTLMNEHLADMIFTDPPYGVSIGNKNKFLNTIQKAGRCVENIENDTLSEEELSKLLCNAFKLAKENITDKASVYVCSPQGGGLGMMMMMMRDAGLPIKHTIIWVKNSPTFSMGRLDYEYQHEPILYTWKKTHEFYGNGDIKTSVWNIDKPRESKLHPTMKPIALMTNAILNSSKEEDIILDLFGGSGSTLIAAEQTNRKCYMMELDPKYCEVIARRWEKLTGKTRTQL